MIKWERVRRGKGGGWVGRVLGQSLYRVWYDRAGIGGYGSWCLGFWSSATPPVRWHLIQHRPPNNVFGRFAAGVLKDQAATHFAESVAPALAERLKLTAGEADGPADVIPFAGHRG